MPCSLEHILHRQAQRDIWAGSMTRMMQQLSGDLLGHLGTIELCLSEYLQKQHLVPETPPQNNARHLHWGIQAVEAIYAQVKRQALQIVLPEPQYVENELEALITLLLKRCGPLLRERRIVTELTIDPKILYQGDRSLLLCALMRVILLGASFFHEQQRLKIIAQEDRGWIRLDIEFSGAWLDAPIESDAFEAKFLEDPQLLQLHHIFQLHRGGILLHNTERAFSCAAVFAKDPAAVDTSHILAFGA